MQIKTFIPWMMVVARAALGPVVLLGERCRWNGVALAGLVLTALLSDIFDGVLARRWKSDTAALRLADSMADTLFYLFIAVTIATSMPLVWIACRKGALVVLALEASRFTFDLIKYRKPGSYHSYLAKSWGLVLATAVSLAFFTQRPSLWMTAAVILGLLSNAESLAMSIVLPVWRRDVKTLALAWRIRTQWAQQRAQAGALGVAIALTMVIFGSVRAQAQSLQDVTYVGGTVLPGNGLHGKVSIASTDTFIFQGPTKIQIPYDHVISFESSIHKVVHVGLLTEGIWRLVAPWPEKKRISITFHDSADHPQLMVLELSRGDEAMLVEVLKARVARPGPPTPKALLRPTPAAQAKGGGR